MLPEPGHLSDEEILLLLDGESTRSATRKAQRHLAACWLCRSRQGKLETTIEDFVARHRHTLEPEVTDSAGPTALMRARLAEAAARPTSPVRSFWQLPMLARTFALACAAVVLVVLGSRVRLRNAPPAAPVSAASAMRTVPDRALTPGATRPVALHDVCALRHEEVVRDVSDTLRQQVFHEYGIVDPHPEDFEVDYLIAPGLGGTDDIRNLWPEPSTPSAWNAHRKDELEERLHQLVCGGALDLATAQQAIATDWVTAWEKYCNPDVPVGLPAGRPQRARQYASRHTQRPSTTA